MSSRRVPLRCLNNLQRETDDSKKDKSLKSSSKKQSRNDVSIIDVLRKCTNQRGIHQENLTPNTSRSLSATNSDSVPDSCFSLFDDFVPEELSTFFEPSRIEHQEAKNLRPRCVIAEDIFPGDDLFNDIPWLGVRSPTFSRKRKACAETRENSSDILEVSSDAESEEAEAVQRPSPRKRRKFIIDDPVYKEWREKTNAEFHEIAQHELTVEEDC